jgi:hypothetical protein
MAEREIRSFVTSNLHKIVGFAEKSVVEYVVALGA